MRILFSILLLSSIQGIACGGKGIAAEPSNAGTAWVGHRKNPGDVLENMARQRMAALEASDELAAMAPGVKDLEDEPDADVLLEMGIPSFLLPSARGSTQQQQIERFLQSRHDYAHGGSGFDPDRIFSEANERIRRHRRESTEGGIPVCPLIGQLSSAPVEVADEEGDGSEPDEAKRE